MVGQWRSPILALCSAGWAHGVLHLRSAGFVHGRIDPMRNLAPGLHKRVNPSLCPADFRLLFFFTSPQLGCRVPRDRFTRLARCVAGEAAPPARVRVLLASEARPIRILTVASERSLRGRTSDSFAPAKPVPVPRREATSLLPRPLFHGRGGRPPQRSAVRVLDRPHQSGAAK